MKKILNPVMLLSLFFINKSLLAQQDEPGCKDHPFVSRMPGFYIYSCEKIDWAAVEFKDQKGSDITIEGKVYKLEYNLKEGEKEPSPFQIVRNYENAIKKIGGRVIYDVPESGWTWLEFEKQSKKINLVVYAVWGGYYLTIVERKAMEQEVVASAKTLLDEIKSKGHASVYGIYFDFNNAKIKPKSEKAINEIAKLLKQNPSLKLYVVGHTDNVGEIDYNLKLSKARADAVVKELVTKHGISSSRLKPYGVGPLAPVESNDTEEGRAKNRRVELVKQ